MIIEWTVVIIFIVIGIILLKLEHSTRKYKVIAIILILIVIYFSIAMLFSSDQIDLRSPSGIIKATYLYIGWIGETSSKLWGIGTDTVKLVGNAIKINNTSQEQPKN